MNPSLKIIALLPWLFAGSTHVQAFEVGLRYYNIQKHELAEALDQIDEQYDEREKPLKEQRRNAAYDSPAHREASAKIDALQEERDREFLRRLEGVPPDLQYITTLEAGESHQQSTKNKGKPVHTEFKLGQVDGNKIPLEINIEYDGRKLYKGSALLLPFNTPYVVTQSSIKIQGKRQGTLMFVEVRR